MPIPAAVISFGLIVQSDLGVAEHYIFARLDGAIMPASTAVSSLCPLPSTPATPTISPAIDRQGEVVEPCDALISLLTRQAIDLQRFLLDLSLSASGH